MLWQSKWKLKCSVLPWTRNARPRPWLWSRQTYIITAFVWTGVHGEAPVCLNVSRCICGQWTSSASGPAVLHTPVAAAPAPRLIDEFVALGHFLHTFPLSIIFDGVDFRFIIRSGPWSFSLVVFLWTAVSEVFLRGLLYLAVNPLAVLFMKLSLRRWQGNLSPCILQSSPASLCSHDGLFPSQSKLFSFILSLAALLALCTFSTQNRFWECTHLLIMANRRLPLTSWSVYYIFNSVIIFSCTVTSSLHILTHSFHLPIKWEPPKNRY